MNIVIGTVLIWAAALALLRHIARVEPATLPEVWRASRTTFLMMLPRTVVGLSGASFMAALLPADQMSALFGSEQGIAGVLLACALGGLTPGGPIVAFALCATALKAGAGTGALLGYLTAWSVVSLTRTLGHEIGMMGNRFVLRRLLLSAPFAVIVGLLAQGVENLW